MFQGLASPYSPFQEIPLAKPNYRHAKKQKESARKARQEAKQQRRANILDAPTAAEAPALAETPALAEAPSETAVPTKPLRD